MLTPLDSDDAERRKLIANVVADIAEELRLIWNARGAADIAKIEFEIPNVWTSPEPAGALARALRSLDR